jgi:hypothetical protein
MMPLTFLATTAHTFADQEQKVALLSQKNVSSAAKRMPSSRFGAMVSTTPTAHVSIWPRLLFLSKMQQANGAMPATGACGSEHRQQMVRLLHTLKMGLRIRLKKLGDVC